MSVAILETIIDEMRLNFNEYPFETGGVLFEKNGIISHFFFDKGRQNSDMHYVLNAEQLNRQIISKAREGFCFCGIVHSHFERRTLSVADILYAKNALIMNNVSEISMYLYVKKADELLRYVVYKDSDEHNDILQPEKVEVIQGDSFD